MVLSDGWTSMRGLAWSADGTEIWFTGNRGGAEITHGVYAVTPAGVQNLIDERLAVTEERLRNDIAVLADSIDTQYRQLATRVNRTQSVTIEDLQQSLAPATSLGRRVSFQGR